MASENSTVVLMEREEKDQINRNLVSWANTFPGLPDDLIGIIPVDYEDLPAASPCMALSTIQSANITNRYILGGYKAEIQFKVIYRVKPGSSPDKRLMADELLDYFGSWARTQHPFIGDNMRVIRIEATTRSSKFDAYEGGLEDHQILMKMTYEVNV